MPKGAAGLVAQPLLAVSVLRNALFSTSLRESLRQTQTRVAVLLDHALRISNAPAHASTHEYMKPAAGETLDHSAPTAMLETKSPIPFVVARTPKPEPRFSVASKSAARAFS